MSGLRKHFDRWARRRSIRYTHIYQRTVFGIYITKYINKYIKLLTPDALGCPELFEYVSNNEDARTMCTVIRKKRWQVINTLLSGYCSSRPPESTHQNHYSQYDVVRKQVDDIMLTRMKQVMEDNGLFTQEFTLNVCEVAAALRQSFVHSETTAKAKVAEHWVERMPPLILFSLVSLVLKMSNIGYAMSKWGFDVWDFVDLFTHVYMCLVAVYLVFLRVPQSIYADAKKSSSNVYIDCKTSLHLHFLRKAGTYDTFMKTTVESLQM